MGLLTSSTEQQHSSRTSADFSLILHKRMKPDCRSIILVESVDSTLVLAMVYDSLTQSSFGLCLSSNLKKKHVSAASCASVFRHRNT
jgi:hypothetical protein